MGRGFLLVVLLAFAAGPDPDAPDLAPGERVAALLERVRLEQEAVKTLEASFVQHSESPLLLEPEEVEGTFLYRAPDQIRWDFGEPKNVTLLIRGNESVTWYRDLGRVERQDLGAQGERMLELVGASPSLEKLQRYFSLRVTFPKAPEKPYVLELDPVSRRVAKRIRAMTVEIDREGFFLSALRYEGPDGEVTAIAFEDVRVNAEIPAERFQLPDVPARAP